VIGGKPVSMLRATQVAMLIGPIYAKADVGTCGIV
jgi:hypothetical protein